MTELQDIEHWLESLDFSAWRFAENAYDFWLDLRDREPFDSDWITASLMVREQESGNPLNQEELEALTRISKRAFFKALEATGHTEMAEYVSDDFDLLARAARLGLEDAWLKALRHVYQQERFPFGTFGEV